MILNIINIICVCAVMVFVLIMAESCRENNMLEVNEYDICSDKINNKLRVVMVSDLHNAEFGNNNDMLISKIQHLNPDIVLIAGDVMVGKAGVSPQVAVDFLNRLGTLCDVYVSKGNHEMRTSLYLDQYGSMWNYMYENTKEKVTWLINDAVYLEEYNITITGLDMDAVYYRRFKLYHMDKEYLVNTLPDINNGSYNILLAHNPDYFLHYAAWGADMTFSGHVHGGIMIIPKLGGLISPMLRLFPKYYKGMYDIDAKKMILSGGLGSHTIKARVNNKPEIVVVNFHG
jgi:hypothetical protein